MVLRFLCASLFLLGAVGLTARGDFIFVKGRDKPVTGDVKSEDAKAVVVAIKKTSENIPGADVLDIHYEDVKPTALRLSGGAYKVAKDSEKESLDGADAFKRKAALDTAITKYGETLKKMDPPHKYAIRTIRYKIATLLLRQAQTAKLPTDKAIAKLQEFRNEFPNSWEINQVMPLMAQVQMDEGDFKGAAVTLQDMADMEVLPADVRLNAKLMIVQVAVRGGDIKDAQKKLSQLEAESAGNPKLASRVKMAKAEVLVGLKQTDEAMKLLQQVVKENNDKETKALAHNTLGECLFKANRYNEARWEFLWVDAVFNQDRSQHAKALYYLAKTFQQLNDEPRAQECRETLLSGQFTGTEWQKKAQKEAGN